MKKIPFILFRPGGGTFVLAFLLGLVLLQTGCHTPEPAVAAPPSADWLVERTAWEWVVGEAEERYRDAEVFFANPPTDPALVDLQSAARLYGYDFADLRQRTWALVANLEHLGQ